MNSIFFSKKKILSPVHREARMTPIPNLGNALQEDFRLTTSVNGNAIPQWSVRSSNPVKRKDIEIRMCSALSYSTLQSNGSSDCSRFCFTLLWLHFEKKKIQKSSHLDGQVNTICLAPTTRHRQINNLFLKAKWGPLFKKKKKSHQSKWELQPHADVKIKPGETGVITHWTHKAGDGCSSLPGTAGRGDLVLQWTEDLILPPCVQQRTPSSPAALDGLSLLLWLFYSKCHWYLCPLVCLNRPCNCLLGWVLHVASPVSAFD